MRENAAMRRTPLQDRVLASVLFTDIVGSTERAAQIGDRRWQELVARHHRVVRAQLKRFRGREIDTAGDGFFATFDSPAQAIGCALGIMDALRPLNIDIRAGVHFGELELSGSDRKVGGIAVHTGARVAAMAGAGEILVTATVRELVAGSDFEFEDRATVSLKGVPGDWHLFAVVRPEAAETIETAAESVQPATAARARLSRLWAVIGLAAVIGLVAVGAAILLPPLLAGPVRPGVNTVGYIPPTANAFALAVPVGAHPNGLAIGDGAVWVTNFSDQTLSRIDLASRKVTAAPSIGGQPTGVTLGAGAVWITTRFGLTSGENGSVVRFSTGQVTREPFIPVGNGVEAIAFGADAVWVADELREVVLEIDPATNVVLREVPVGRSPGAIAVGAGSIWVTSVLDRTVWRIDPITYTVQAQIAVAAPTSLAVTEDVAWVTSETTDTVTRIDTATNGATLYEGKGDGPRSVAVAGDSVWVALGAAGQVIRIDAASGEILARLDVDGFPDAIAVDDQGGVWVAVHSP